ncbi:MAG: hypothetical protein K2Z81_20890 [Cyanobacteria bacterium]|nr:hypothetical protein [Cyanobacteriota bacterium]
MRNATSEQDFRLSILNALLRTPHRNVQPYIPLFRQVHDRDPLFFSRLAVWYCESGAVHDLKQLFISFLCTSKFSDEFREAGQALLDGLPPYQVERVFKMIKGHRDGTHFVAGIAPSVPRSFKTAVEQYLREREARPEQFDNVVLHARKSMKSLYASLRIKPSEYAQKVLFDNDPPEGSRLYVLKELAKTDDPVEQARLIIKSKLPYRIAVSAIKTVTPSVLVSLINAMTPQEVINNLSSLQARGAMDNPELRKLIDKKLESARGDKRVSALKTREAIKAASLDDEMAEKVASVGDAKIKTHGKIRKSTALLVDKSSSMDQAIEVGKQIASIFAPVCEADLYVYAFDTIAYPIKPKGNELSDWEKAFKGIIASGGTSCGVGIETLRRNKERVEQIIMVTDQEENTPPFMLDALRKYADDMKVQPDVLFVSVERFHSLLLKELTAAGIMTDNYAFTGDYYSLPGLIPLVSGGTRLDLLMEIMSRELPTKKVKATAI